MVPPGTAPDVPISSADWLRVYEQRQAGILFVYIGAMSIATPKALKL